MTDATPEAKDLSEQLGGWLDEHSLSGWTPILGAPQQQSYSWYNGLPADYGADAVPSCGECSEPMELILGLDVATLPDDLGHPFESGVIEVFYCDNGDYGCETWEPYSPSHHVRLVRSFDWTTSSPEAAQTIIGWQPEIDRPDRPDLIHLGAKITFKEDDFRFAVPAADIDIHGVQYGRYLDDVIGTPTQGDKLGGWPNWVQNRERPSCRECGDEMVHLYQLDNGGHHNLMFGDAGCAYVSYCRTHPDVLTMLWQCH